MVVLHGAYCRADLPLRTALFNAGFGDIGVCPGVELEAIEANALDPDGKFANEGADGPVELAATHAQVCRGSIGSQNSWGKER